MTYGFSVIGDNLNDVFVNSLGLVKMASGTAPATAANSTGSQILYPSSISNPMLFVRPSALNASPISVRGESSLGFLYRSTNYPMDWVVYAINAPSQQDSGYGFNAYDETGNIMLSSNNPPPNINSIGILFATHPTNSNWVSDVSVSGMARDGGLLYVSASSLEPAILAPAVPQPPLSAMLTISATYTSLTNIRFSLTNSRFVNNVYTYAPLGCLPRTYALIK